MTVDIGLNNPFAEQLEFFRNKLALPSERYDDILKAAHDRAFIVAGAANADLVNDLHQAMQRRIEDGKGLEAFRKEFKDVVLKHGWVGWTGEGSAAGHAWRTRVIYQTNMATSYAAGRWKQLTNPALLSVRPYWKYHHADGVMHPRPLHVSWDGLVLPWDHPFWLTHFPPNGWFCHCWVTAVDQKEYDKAKAEGRATPPPGWDTADPITGAPPGIDKGFDYAPGASVSKPLKEFIDEKLINLDAPVGASMYEAMRPILQQEMQAAYQAFLGEVLADPVKRGRVAIVGAIAPETLAWLEANKAIVPVTAEIAVQDALIVGRKAIRHQEAGDALTADDWARLPDILEKPDQILFDTVHGKLFYVASTSDPQRDARIAVEFDYLLKKKKGETNLLVSAFRVSKDALAGWIVGKLYEVVM
ncbi:phage minor head protein [Herbaspirillum sp. ST 5-3]|uniref:phage minor head protein n=1 Tax=Oxalobacteraceae TaxID=75682 RepID=UPI0010A4BA67|nr:phage minor head protein [Herbaspirillum sp. ST 5-3]